MIKYKGNILEKLKACGYSSYRIRIDKIMSQKQLTDIRNNKVTMSTLNLLCQLLDCQPGDILEYLPDEKNE